MRRRFLILLIFSSWRGEPVNAQKPRLATGYQQFFPSGACDWNAYKLAVDGYQKLLRLGLLNNQRYLSIIDYSKPSHTQRFFVLDLEQKQTIISSITAHGLGSDPDSTTVPYRFSNRDGSRATSVGFYITGNTYTNHRPLDSIGLCLFGLDKGFNDSAAHREIVLHYGATEYTGRIYVTDSGAARSFGCPALPLSTNTRIINLIKEGSCVFVYSPKAKTYEQASSVLHSRLRFPIVQHGPPPNNCSCMLQPRAQK